MAWFSPFSKSGATQDSLQGPYYKFPYTNTYRYTLYLWFVMSLTLPKPSSFSPFPLTHSLKFPEAPTLWGALLLLKLLTAENGFQLAQIGQLNLSFTIEVSELLNSLSMHRDRIELLRNDTEVSQ